jgi:hypothetical protein
MKTHVLVLVLLCSAVPTAGDAAQLIPHEALYDLSVRNWRLPSEISRVIGSQITRLTRSCTDWTNVAVFRLQAETTAGDSIDFETDYESVESFDGKRLQFRKTTKANGELIETLLGVAAHSTDGTPGTITVLQPTPQTLPLPTETIFPVASIIHSMSQWEAGMHTLNYTMFDGGTLDVSRVFEILVGQVPPTPDLAEADPELLEGQAWRSTMSFYSYEEGNDEPLITITQNIMPSGVAVEMTQDIGFADVVLNLRRVRALPQPEC